MKISTWVRVRNPNEWSLRKKHEVLSFTLDFQWLWLSSWHVCNSRLTGVLAVLGLVRRTGTAELVVVGCGGLWWDGVRETGCKSGGTGASQIPLLHFRSQDICPSERHVAARGKNLLWKATFGNNSADFRRQKRLLSYPGTTHVSEKTVGRGLAGFPDSDVRVLGTLWSAHPWASDTDKLMLEGKGLCSLPRWRSSLIFGWK